MFLKFLTLFSLISSIYCNCFTENDVINSNKLFMYKGNVYDITGYKHPGGKSDLLKTIGQDLDVFLKNPKYKFHVGKRSFVNDLKDMYVGKLSDICDITPNTPEANTTTQSFTTTYQIITTSQNNTTTQPFTTTSQNSTTSKLFTTQNQPCTIEPIINNSSQVKGISTFLVLSFIFVYYLYI